MMINKFLKDSLLELKDYDSKYISAAFREAVIMNKFGVKDHDSLKKFHYISQYVPIFVKNVCGECDKKLSSKVLDYILRDGLDKISCSNDIKEGVIRYFSKNTLVKKAYPNEIGDIDPIKKYDINKWKTALNDITIRKRLYGNMRLALDYVTKDWGDMDEKKDFEYWTRQQEQGISKLYRTAFEVGSDDIALQYIPGLNSIPNKVENQTVQNKDNTKKKVLARIQSIKKILATSEGQKLLGSNYNKIMSAILDLERDILGVRTAGMIKDVIYRTANYLEKENCDKNVVDSLNKIAQMPALPSDLSGMGLGLDMGGGAAPAPTGTEAVQETEDSGKSPVQEFKESFMGYQEGTTPETISNNFEKILDEFKEKKSKASWHNYITPELKHFEKVAEDVYRTIKLIGYANRPHRKFAQEMAPEPTEPMPARTPVDAPMDLKEPEIPKAKPEGDMPKPEGIVPKPEKLSPQDELKSSIRTDSAGIFSDIKLSDVIAQLEALSKVFQNREIARQLSIIDLMLDALGISGFFPSLAEATRSALESNQYCQSRIEEILSRLVSSIDSEGESIINSDKLDPAKKNRGGLVDKEMEEYLSEKSPEVRKEQPKPVEESAEESVLPTPEQTPKETALPAQPKPATPPPVNQPLPTG